MLHNLARELTPNAELNADVVPNAFILSLMGIQGMGMVCTKDELILQQIQRSIYFPMKSLNTWRKVCMGSVTEKCFKE